MELIFHEFYLLEEAKAIYVTFPNGTVKTLTESDRLVEDDEIEYYQSAFHDLSFPSNMSGPYYHYLLTADSSGTYEYYIEFKNGNIKFNIDNGGCIPIPTWVQD